MNRFRLLAFLLVLLSGLPVLAYDYPPYCPAPPTPMSDSGDAWSPSSTATPTTAAPFSTNYSTPSSYTVPATPIPPPLPAPTERSPGPAIATSKGDAAWLNNTTTVIAPPERPVDSSWYTRIDWFHWAEQIDGFDFVTESGALYTVGYERKVGPERFRVELFGGDMGYDGYGQFDNGDLEPLSSTTHYLGARGEIEYLYAPELWEDRANFVFGLGSRVWIRDLTGGIGDYGTPIWGYQEAWWTIYPYLGLEARRPLGGSWLLYSQARIGATAFTYSYASIADEPVWPRCGITSQVEVGLRGKHFFLSGECEVMTWSESSVVEGLYQPNSQMVTVGGRCGLHF